MVFKSHCGGGTIAFEAATAGTIAWKIKAGFLFKSMFSGLGTSLGGPST